MTAKSRSTDAAILSSRRSPSNMMVLFGVHNEVQTAVPIARAFSYESLVIATRNKTATNGSDQEH
eukprot:scaffold25949_cov137-Cylindrotheca_fusiformis.AAC.1